ncbi:galactose-3-O-sulfotransferase 3 isoform X2 [Ictalurus punctatus]|nr:galactose-3-O-sulfotransferase 3 isoform X2 [Ictalurus punctatus]XP_053537579.1 galactose-3-O-sulfotransferase 3 isoform X2 [Ictalurus punctatus]XP_053537580.1 galactose-3-O-sulfotransferase 3 isoform X2 [Ictalurus punctatus]XP_053537581.1 galactose-3-O-sulfotransferase 3 isoform X2 [Ictalurus punctatus]XP_053537582.1 galactose-3-O-sulfotransferase 3 isoform X2 [Ictalurus punctatus]XP_053537583.1 galactose-3-O-sulfotransferase 3 isoform X2 [Ictalurus punctatus]XP_053537584.1 galactose-3-O-
MMSQKKIFLLLVAVSTVSLLLHHGGHLDWTMEVFRLSCPSMRSSQTGTRVKHTNVVFLKTHKTASTTVQNILFRFAERNNLTVALPVTSCDHQFCYPRTFSSHFVLPYTMPPNIVTNHMRFSYSELQRIMPNNTIYITILREPGTMFESQFTYFNQHCEAFKRVPNGSLAAFLEKPQAYYRPKEEESMYARNTLTFDLGGDKDRPSTDVSYAKRFAAEVERVFSLVMIAEYFDESLVLLRHLLSWDLEDVLYFKQNMRMASSKGNLSEAQLQKIREWNSIDAALYDHFNASLWRRLNELGPACVAREVKLLRRAQEQMIRGCFGGSLPRIRSASEITNKQLRPWQPSSKVAIVGYDLPVNVSKESGMSKDVCLKMIMPEVQYTRQLLQLQMLRYRSRYFVNKMPRNGLKPFGQFVWKHPYLSTSRNSVTLGRRPRAAARFFHQARQRQSHN